METGVSEETLASMLVILLDEALFCGKIVVAGLLALALFSGVALPFCSVVNKVDVVFGDDAHVITGIAALHISRPGGKKSVTLLLLRCLHNLTKSSWIDFETRHKSNLNLLYLSDFAYQLLNRWREFEEKFAHN